MRSRPDWFARLLARLLPWFDQAQYDRDRASTDRVLNAADRIRLGYRAAGERLER